MRLVTICIFDDDKDDDDDVSVSIFLDSPNDGDHLKKNKNQNLVSSTSHCTSGMCTFHHSSCIRSKAEKKTRPRALSIRIRWFHLASLLLPPLLQLRARSAARVLFTSSDQTIYKEASFCLTSRASPVDETIFSTAGSRLPSRGSKGNMVDDETGLLLLSFSFPVQLFKSCVFLCLDRVVVLLSCLLILRSDRSFLSWSSTKR